MENKYDFANFPSLGNSTETLESYNASRYSDRFEHEDFSRMTKQELKASKKKIEDQIASLEEEQDNEEDFNKRSYLIDEQIQYRQKELKKLEKYLNDEK